MLVVFVAVRTTVVLDEIVVAKVKQSFGGNLSRGVNTILHEHLFKEKKKESAFGLLKGMGASRELAKLKEEERREEKRHEKLYR